MRSFLLRCFSFRREILAVRPTNSIMRTLALLMLAILRACRRTTAPKPGMWAVPRRPCKSDSDGKLSATDDLFLEYRCKGKELHVQYTNINLIEYGQNVDRRYIMAALVSPLLHLEQEAAALSHPGIHG